MVDGTETSSGSCDLAYTVAPADASLQGPARQPLQVVAVDDDPTIRLLLGRLFESDRRFDLVATACDGREAVAIVAAHQPDLVVPDVTMPHMDGIAAAAQIRRACPDAQIVMCSGDHDRRDEALRAGAVEWVDKPFTIGELTSTLLTATTNGQPTPQRDQLRGPDRPADQRPTRTPTPSTLPRSPIGATAAAGLVVTGAKP